jgi:FtsH-binding integral membrane protein
MRQVTSLLGSGLLFAGAVVAVVAGPYSHRAAPVLASAIELLALATLLLTLTGNSEWSPVTGILLLLVMTMPLAGLTLGRSFPAPLTVGDLRCWVPLYLGLALLAISGRSFGEASPAEGQPARAGFKHRILLELYELCVMMSAVLLGCRMAASW